MKKRYGRTRVLALHPPGATPDFWDEIVAAAPQFEVLAPDLVALLHAVGGRLGPLVRALVGMVPRRRVLLTGCEIGANIALEVAALLGERAAGVLLLSPQPVRPGPTYRERMRMLAKLTRTNMDADEAAAMAPLMVNRANGRSQATETAAAMLREAGGAASAPLLQLAADFPEGYLALKLIRAPVRALFGAESLNPFPGPNWISDWRKALGSENVDLLAEARQWLALEDPQRIAAELCALDARSGGPEAHPATSS